MEALPKSAIWFERVARLVSQSCAVVGGVDEAVRDVKAQVLAHRDGVIGPGLLVGLTWNFSEYFSFSNSAEESNQRMLAQKPFGKQSLAGA